MANEFKVLVYMTAILGTGYGLMKYTVPDEEQIKKVYTITVWQNKDTLKPILAFGSSTA